ncbi:MAG TPA: hypothetical protein VF503_12015 [Sphingobium sp.]|uniref:hypothetical protein n=1 Tax=Sphingobium sp. TaxID=1912891 RepID=UPI002ED35340
MIDALRKWASTFKESWAPLLEALSGADDPRGDHVYALEGRIRKLEAEMATLKPRPEPADTGQGD